jgi:hypothetical protein
VIRRALDLLVAAINRGDSEARWLLSGPGLLTRAATQVLAEAGEAWPAVLARIAIPPPWVLHGVAATGLPPVVDVA